MIQAQIWLLEPRDLSRRTYSPLWVVPSLGIVVLGYIRNLAESVMEWFRIIV